MSPMRPARQMTLALLAAAALGGSGVATAAGAPKSPSSDTLVWRGDVTTARAVVDEVAKAWQKTGHGHIELQPFNTASGLEAVASGKADIAGSARGPNGSAAERALTFTPVGWDALVMITHPGNPASNLTLKQLHDIYYGKLHNWKAVGGTDKPIDVYAVASPGDGVEFSVRKLLFGRGNQPVAAPRLYINTAKLEAAVALDRQALGVTTLAGIRGNARVKALRIDGVAPSMSSVANGSYKLFAPLYLVTNPAGPHAAEAKAFVAFLDSDAAKAALRKHGIVPYDDGARLAAMDSARRTAILAEVGARAPRPTPASPVAAPGATYAARAAVAPTSPRTAQARQALEQRRAHAASLASVTGDATTVADAAAHGPDFAKVTGDAHVLARTYTVARGDTLSVIARKHAVTVANLRAWNHLSSDQVKVGQRLRLGGR